MHRQTDCFKQCMPVTIDLQYSNNQEVKVLISEAFPLHCKITTKYAILVKEVLYHCTAADDHSSNYFRNIPVYYTLTAITPSLSSSARWRMNSSSSSHCFLVAPTQLLCRRCNILQHIYCFNFCVNEHLEIETVLPA